MSDSTPTPPQSIGLIARMWRAVFGDPKPTEIWKTESEEYLRTEDLYCYDPHYPIDSYAVYALHQVSLTTGNRRIVEQWRLA